MHKYVYIYICKYIYIFIYFVLFTHTPHAEGKDGRTPELDLGPPLQEDGFPLPGEDGLGNALADGGLAQYGASVSSKNCIWHTHTHTHTHIYVYECMFLLKIDLNIIYIHIYLFVCRTHGNINSLDAHLRCRSIPSWVHDGCRAASNLEWSLGSICL